MRRCLKKQQIASLCGMRFAADLHIHSRYAGGVSPEMTVENIAFWAQLKGVDLLATGDCLQAEWLSELEANLREAEPGFYALRSDLESSIGHRLPTLLFRPLRFIVSTEVCCAPPGTPQLGGLHHLLYFQSLANARRFRERIAEYGDFSDGRPMLTLNSEQLLEAVLEHGEGTQLAPAHVFNPWFSSLGTVSGGRTLKEIFGDKVQHILAVETGLTSTPRMCRRVASLDQHSLFSCSDAHKLQNIGRECTILEIDPNYAALMAALRNGNRREVAGTLKFPLERTRYYRNRCGICEESFDDMLCPNCGRALVMGSRDRLEIVADRAEPIHKIDAPPFSELLPLSYLLAGFLRVGPDSKTVKNFYSRITQDLGHERFILTEAAYDDILRFSTPQIARAIIEQRIGTPLSARLSPTEVKRPADTQLSLGLG
jgi:PHP family Zn ribbon phosphoesterase